MNYVIHKAVNNANIIRYKQNIQLKRSNGGMSQANGRAHGVHEPLPLSIYTTTIAKQNNQNF